MAIREESSERLVQPLTLVSSLQPPINSMRKVVIIPILYMRRLRLRDETAPSRAQRTKWQSQDSDPQWPAVLWVWGLAGQRGLPSSSTSSIISCSSSGVGFWPSILITLPSSLVLMQPSSAPSTKMSKAALNSVSDGGWGVEWSGLSSQDPRWPDPWGHLPTCPLPSETPKVTARETPASGLQPGVLLLPKPSPVVPRCVRWVTHHFSALLSAALPREEKRSQDSGSGSSCC